MHAPPDPDSGPGGVFNSWLNTVAACGRCHQRKGDRTPSEARMPLRTAPTVPTWAALSLR